MPFRAVSSFVDPQASFALKFDIAAAQPEAGEAEVLPASEPETPKALPAKAAPKAARSKSKAVKPKDGDEAAVVSLDAFRKKNG